MPDPLPETRNKACCGLWVEYPLWVSNHVWSSPEPVKIVWVAVRLEVAAGSSMPPHLPVAVSGANTTGFPATPLMSKRSIDHDLRRAASRAVAGVERDDRALADG